MQEAKKQNSPELDGIDREILRVLFIRRPLVGSQIAKIVGLSPSGVKSRLEYLRNSGIVKIAKTSGQRNFERKFGNKLIKIKSARSIYWDLDLKEGEK
ncbi:MAG: winged helix-turn-helix transcriptional regulator [Candidatus Nanoarchaeia archaeon]